MHVLIGILFLIILLVGMVLTYEGWERSNIFMYYSGIILFAIGAAGLVVH